ncbi:MAG: hypothetical protein ACRC0V_00375 [Fusobacteriaceae bacterium]
MEIKNIKKHETYGITFDVALNEDLTLYGCSYKKGSGANGAYEFVGSKQIKGKDEKWYPTAFISKKLSSKIIEEYKKVAKDDEDDSDSFPF